MKLIVVAFAATALLAGTATAFAQGQDNRDHGRDKNNVPPHTAMHEPAASMKNHRMNNDHRADWKRGGHIAREDWRRGAAVDYRAHHLRRPPRGYEWREVDGNYVLAAVATGLIASVILANH